MEGLKIDKKYWAFETFKNGYETVWKEYQIIAMRHLWEIGEEGAGSGKSWRHVNVVLKERGRSISRASLIFFLNDMVDQGVLKFRDATGKGGHHRIYYPAFDETGFREYLAAKIIDHLLQEFPDETRTVLGKMKQGKTWRSIFARKG